MLKTKEEIINWLNKHRINSYHINEDLTVDVNETVRLVDYGFNDIPIKFNIINGDFDCSYNKLINIIFAPIKINGSFLCNSNFIKDITNMPKKVTGNFNCSNNNIKSLVGFNCDVGKRLIISNNEFVSLFDIGSNFNVGEEIVMRDGFKEEEILLELIDVNVIRDLKNRVYYEINAKELKSLLLKLDLENNLLKDNEKKSVNKI